MNHRHTPPQDHAVTPGGQTTDPVCGMSVDPATAAGSAEHRGNTYHFCSSHCLHRFKADPNPYTGPAAPHAPQVATTSPAGQGDTVYTCPMHPEVRQDHPGA